MSGRFAIHNALYAPDANEPAINHFAGMQQHLASSQIFTIVTVPLEILSIQQPYFDAL